LRQIDSATKSWLEKIYNHDFIASPLSVNAFMINNSANNEYRTGINLSNGLVTKLQTTGSESCQVENSKYNQSNYRIHESQLLPIALKGLHR
jgi:hypothetical protein